LAGKQGALMCDTPLTLAETASVFGEMLTFQKLLASAPDKKTRKIMLAGKVEDMLNTVVRQIAFYSFEKELHARRAVGELTPDDIGAIWMKVQAESLGPALVFDENYKNYWAYIGHFIHSPFYVYAYAFGDCLVNALYGVYQEQKTQFARDEFAKKYLAMLTAGGTLRHKALLKPFGLDATKPDFWNKGLKVIAGMVDELEKL
jgi:oligoendopeptidase F